MQTVKVFVYGTLKRGKHNHEFIEHCQFVGDFHTGPGYKLLIQGLPFLIKDDNGIGCKGEVYEVDPKTLSQLDMLEGHPNWYERKRIKLYDLNSRDVDYAYCYLIPKDRI